MSSSLLNAGAAVFAGGATFAAAGADAAFGVGPLVGLGAELCAAGAPGNRLVVLPNPVEAGRGSGAIGRGRGAAAGRGSACIGRGGGGVGTGRGCAGGGVGVGATGGFAGSAAGVACHTLPHFEQRTLRPVGGIAAGVSKRVLQAGQIMSVIVENHLGPACGASSSGPPLSKSIDTGGRVQHKDASWAEC
jgi:hypothetical protein